MQSQLRTISHNAFTSTGSKQSHCISKYFNMTDQNCWNFSTDDDQKCSGNEIPEKRVYYRKFRSIKRKKRKGFAGIRKMARLQSNVDTEDLGQTNEGASSSTAEMDVNNDQDVPNASISKLMNSSFNSDDVGIITRSISAAKGMRDCSSTSSSDGSIIIDKKLLMGSMNNAAICRGCRNPKAQLNLVLRSRKGLAETYYLACSLCCSKTPLETSQKLTGSKRLDKRGGQATYEINCRSVVASLESGRAGLERFCGILNLPKPLSKAAYNKQLLQLEEASVKVCESIMNEAATRLINITEKEDMGMIEINDDGHKLAKVAVTVDGTWQKRGYSSKNGIVFVISVRTGEVLDFEVLSLVCHQCQAHDKTDHFSDQYKQWKEKHQPLCPINHSGSSGEMETKGAIRIFLLSIKQRSLKYIIMVGDGDTGCFGSVHEALKREYGDAYQIKKEECVGHIQKRLGKSLRDLKVQYKGRKLADGKGIGGSGRLTDKAIDKMQNNYGSAIRKNKGKLDQMHDSVQAILKHMVQEEGKSLEEQHSLCPKDNFTWCKFWKDKGNNTKTYSEEHRLPSVFFNLLKPTYDRLSDVTLLQRCLKGITQNQNESLHGMLWRRCPKTCFSGKRKVKIAACLSVGNFNIGASAIADVLKALDIKCGNQTLRYFRNADKSRLKGAAIKVSKKYKDRRQKLRSMKKRKLDKKEKGYLSGAFGLCAQPESVLKKVKMIAPKGRSGKKQRKTNSHEELIDVPVVQHEHTQLEPAITFLMPLQVIHDFS